jgi:hypothetical protein
MSIAIQFGPLPLTSSYHSGFPLISITTQFYIDSLNIADFFEHQSKGKAICMGLSQLIKDVKIEQVISR